MSPASVPRSPVSPPPSPTLFLIDGYALIYRAFFALISRPLTTSRGENTSAAWGVVNFLNRLLDKHKPDYLGWVNDSGLSFRHETYPDYKATREKLTEELQSDFDRGMERIAALLEAYHVPILTVPGYEADDVIGTLALQGAARGLNTVIVSGDKDFQQMVRPGVWLLNPGRGGPASVEESWVGVENGSERLGVPPALVTDYLSLVGDASDNVPGVKGIGDKGAAELVNTFGDLETILSRVAEITKKRPREALLEQAASARLSKELVTIKCDVPVTLDTESLRVREPDRARLTLLFVELEFHTLARQAAEAMAAGTASPAIGAASNDPTLGLSGEPPVLLRTAPPKVPARYVTVDSLDALEKFIERAREVDHIAVDTEAVVDADSPVKIDPLRSSIVALAIAVAPGEAYYFPLTHRPYVGPQGELNLGMTDRDRDAVTGGVDAHHALDSAEGEDVPDAAGRTRRPRKVTKTAAQLSIAARAIAEGHRARIRNLPGLADPAMAPLKALLEDPTVPKTMQNAKYDILVLRGAGVEIQGLAFDTMVASYVLDPGRRSHGLDLLALEFLQHTMTTYEDLCGKGKGELPYDQVPVDCARDYSCEDADITWRLRDLFEPQLDQQQLLRLLKDVEIPLIGVLADMEAAGIMIDRGWFAQLKTRFQAERERVEELIYTSAGERFNINSNPKLREIIFEKLQLPVLKRTATGPSTDASVLQQLADAGHELPVQLMEYRELSKLESTYIDALPALVNPRTGRLHTSFNQTVAATGRLSSSDPNLQNIPNRRELGREIRRGFVPRKGWRLLAADYSQIELRLMAHLSGDPAFVEAFRGGGDIHKQTAAIIFGIPIEEVTGDMRGRAKTINFATLYGQGAHALSQQLKITHAEAKDFIETYFERFSRVRQFLDTSVEFARKHGYAETIFGRRRYIPELRDRNFNIRAFGERTAANSPIQGSAADLIKMAMINIARALRERRLDSRMLLQVHDELVFEIPRPEEDEVVALVKHEMEHATELTVPLVVDAGVGDNWVETKVR